MVTLGKSANLSSQAPTYFGDVSRPQISLYLWRQLRDQVTRPHSRYQEPGSLRENAISGALASRKTSTFRPSMAFVEKRLGRTRSGSTGMRWYSKFIPAGPTGVDFQILHLILLALIRRRVLTKRERL